MEIRPFTPNDHPTASAWWQLHKWPVVSLDLLPANGIVVEHLNQRICMGFLYQTDSSIAWLEFIVANPLCDKLLRDEALDVLIPALLYRAKELGKSIVFTSVLHPALIKRYQKHGAAIADTNVTQLIWRLN